MGQPRRWHVPAEADASKALEILFCTEPPYRSSLPHAQVMSRSEARGLAVVDAGSKAVSLDSGPPILPPSYTSGIQVRLVTRIKCNLHY